MKKIQLNKERYWTKLMKSLLNWIQIPSKIEKVRKIICFPFSFFSIRFLNDYKHIGHRCAMNGEIDREEESRMFWIRFVCWIHKVSRGGIVSVMDSRMQNTRHTLFGWFLSFKIFQRTFLKIRMELKLAASLFVCFFFDDPFHCIYFGTLSKLKFIIAYEVNWSNIWIWFSAGFPNQEKNPSLPVFDVHILLFKKNVASLWKEKIYFLCFHSLFFSLSVVADVTFTNK